MKMRQTKEEPLLPVQVGSVPWREVALFTLLAYGLTWAWHGIWIAPRLGSLLSAPETPASPIAVYGNYLNFLPGMFGPMLAAVAMRLLVSREGLRDSLKLWQRPSSYAIALLAPAPFLAFVAAALVQGGLAAYSSPNQSLNSVIPPSVIFLIGPEIILALGEEFGWRGYLLPRLMPLGEVRATLTLGSIWALWHLPVILAGVILGGNGLKGVIALHFISVVLASFPYTWLAKSTGYSPAAAAVFHGSVNWSQQRLLGFLAIGNVLAVLAVINLIWIFVIAAVYGMRWLRSRSAASHTQ